MPIPLVSSAAPVSHATVAKAPWRFAAERRLGRVARRLVGVAEAEIPLALSVVGADAALAASRRDRWALACLERAAECADGSEAQGAWVLLAACRPARVRRVARGEDPAPTNRRAPNRRRAGARTVAVVQGSESTDADHR
jgi:hypothetical protein